ncbi:MAG: Helix-turn-helix domain [Pseudomonadota bacterium]|jgi:excisionase family DNA binding protein
MRLTKMSDNSHSSESPKWMTTDEIAELLRISRKAVYHRVERGQIPVHRLGRCYRFNRREIEAALMLSTSFSNS